MATVLVTGFSPFDGRTVNASFVAATSLATQPGLQVLEIPVEWGAPGTILFPLCQLECPEVIIGMGEGREGFFDIETVANNTRRERPDNNGNLPLGCPVDPNGTGRRMATVDADGLHEALGAAGLPIRVSVDAGAFLCEELLYTLETLRSEHAALRTVVFVHVPPYGTRFEWAGQVQTATEPSLGRFANLLLASVLRLHATAVANHQQKKA